MRIEKIHIKGFRNFHDEEITFQNKTLIIGANDVGKTNLIYALRLLFDKSISEHDLELSDSDYNAYSGAEQIEITVTITGVVEECLLSVFGGAVKDDTILIRYTNSKTSSYQFFTGFCEDTLTEIASRDYIKRLNMQCVDTNRDLFSFLRRERVQMLRLAKERLSDIATEEDGQKVTEIQVKLNEINAQISSLHYVSSALDHVNAELAKLSIHNEDQTVQFVAGESDAGRLLDNLVIAYESEDQPLVLGGDGRNNQIFLATWMAKQQIQKDIDQVTFYAIEEPEAHLHPHQQRKLSEYIQKSFEDQVFITSHSPHIAAKFNPRSIVRLYPNMKYTHASCGGCSTMLERVISEFGYRLNSLSAEVLFSDGVLLVEGISEVLFYTAVADELAIDLDRYNITVIAVEGIGFKPYVAVCNALNIPWVLRTDNDIFSKPSRNPSKNYYAGISRIMGILKEINSENSSGLLEYWEQHQNENEWTYDEEPTAEAKTLNEDICTRAARHGLFVSKVDLETDLANSPLRNALEEHYGKNQIDAIIKAMKTKKAENMVDFLSKCHPSLSVLRGDSILNPLTHLVEKVEERIHPGNE